MGLWVTRQSLNLMTLGGLALAVGIVVDEATVEIENIHAKLARLAAEGKTGPGAVALAVRQGNILATAFHPELTAERWWHEYFVSLCSSTPRKG